MCSVALDAMDDPAMRFELAEGRLEVIGVDGELDDHERELVQAAAAGYPAGELSTLRRADRAAAARVPIGSTPVGSAPTAMPCATPTAPTPRRGTAHPTCRRGPTPRAGHRRRHRWWARPASPPSPSAASTTTRPGYYSTGEVRFGTDGHFWTYPQRMSPLFGAMVAESIRTIVDEWTWAGLLDDVDPLTILELGGGEGRLAGDVLDHVWARETETWEPYRRGSALRAG